VQLIVRAGSRHDGSHPGLAHLVEHLVFRAPNDERPDLFAAVEGLGGAVTATTMRDYTAFSLVVAAPHAARALALLPALARPPATDAASVRGERRVIAAELRERARPADTLWDLLLAALWGDHPLTRPPGGSVAGLRALTAHAAARFHGGYYTAPRLLVVGAGACAAAPFAEAVQASLGALPGDGQTSAPDDSPASCPAALEAPWGGAVTYVAVGAAVPGLEHPDNAALRLLDGVLGQGPASRLGRSLRARGLYGGVQARYAAYVGAGVFAALAAGPFADPGAVADALESAVRALGTRPPSPAEMAAARRRQAGTLARRCESNEGLASALGAEALFETARPPDAGSPRLLLNVRPTAARRVAREYLAEATFARAVLRPSG
jgi:predicted Zn-dependent peptidase